MTKTEHQAKIAALAGDLNLAIRAAVKDKCKVNLSVVRFPFSQISRINFVVK